MKPETREFLRRRVAPLLLVTAALTGYAVMRPSLPHDQTIHIVLGDAAPRVEELTIRYGPAGSGTDKAQRPRQTEWSREVTFRYPAPPAGAGSGGAPRIVTHESRLPDGEYDVEIEVATRNDRAFVEREVTLGGGTTSIDVSQAVP